MNIFIREYRANLKAFFFWILGLFILVFAGMTKFTGIESAAGSTNINELMEQFPKVILAVFGMAGVDINTLAGYYSIIGYYVFICGIIYAIHLGSNAVSREMIDKTYEFVFTKPRTRNFVLCMKITAGWMNLLLFSVFNLIFSYLAINALDLNEEINELIVLYTIAVFLVSSVFLAFSVFLSAIVRNPEKGILYANLTFLTAFIMGIVYDLLENGKYIKIISPLKYFEARDLIDNQMDLLFVFICIFLTIFLLVIAFHRFKNRDLILS